MQHKEFTKFIQQDLDRGKLLGRTVEIDQSLQASLKQSKEYSSWFQLQTDDRTELVPPCSFSFIYNNLSNVLWMNLRLTFPKISMVKVLDD